MIKPAWVDWALLPGTLVSEMAYIFGCLITGGEVRRAKLMPPKTESAKNRSGPPSSETTEGLKYVGPMIASLVAILACIGILLACHALLGEPVIREFITGNDMLGRAELPQQLPTHWDLLWEQIESQVRLLRRMSETWANVDWLDWRVPLFIYFSICLSIRLSPLNRPMRPTLAAIMALAVAIALMGMIWPRFSGLMKDLWPLLTYIWALLLFLLIFTLWLKGVMALAHIFLGKPKG